MANENLTREDMNLLLAEIRANRSKIEEHHNYHVEENKRIREEIKHVDKSVTTLKGKFGVIALAFGIVGSKLGHYLPFLR